MKLKKVHLGTQPAQLTHQLACTHGGVSRCKSSILSMSVSAD